MLFKAFASSLASVMLAIAIAAPAAAAKIGKCSQLVQEHAGCTEWGSLTQQRFLSVENGAHSCEAHCKSLDWCANWFIHSNGVQCALAGPEKCTPNAMPDFTFYSYDRECAEEEQESWGAQAKVEIFYSATCPHCKDVLQSAVAPLMQAGLPEDAARVSILPIGYVSGQSHEECHAQNNCKYALAHLCALREAQPMPSAASLPALLQGARFVACGIDATAGGSYFGAAAKRHCAEEAGLTWAGASGLEACSEGGEAFDIMTRLKADHWARFKLMTAGFAHNVGLPWVFLNGHLFTCTGGMCTRVAKPAADQQQASIYGLTTGPTNGLLWHVCKGLSPTPAACDSVLNAPTPQVPATVIKPAYCENCVEEGKFWHNKDAWHKAGRKLSPFVALVVAGAFVSIGGLVVAYFATPPRAAESRVLATADMDGRSQPFKSLPRACSLSSRDIEIADIEMTEVSDQHSFQSSEIQ